MIRAMLTRVPLPRLLVLVAAFVVAFWLALSVLIFVLWSSGGEKPSEVRWRVVKSKSVGGQFAATGTSATLWRPRGAAVRFLGRNVQAGRVMWACSKGVSVASRQGSYRWGLHVLRDVRGKDSCHISAGASSEGGITVEILELL